MRRLVIVTLCVLAVLAALIASLPWLLPSRFAVDRLGEAVRQASGRTLTVNGPVTASIWTDPGIVLHDVVVSNPPGGDPGQVATIEVLKLSLDAGAILARRLDPSSVELIRPRVSLVTNGKGEVNWLAPEGAAAAALPFPVRIVEGDIRYLDERTGATLTLAEANLAVTPAGPDTPFGVEGHATFNNQRLALSLFVKSPRRLAADGSPVDLAIDSPALKVSYSGRASLNRSLSLAGTGELASPSLRELARWGGFAIADGRGLGAVSVTGAVDSAGGVATFQNVDLMLDGMRGKGSLTVDISGPRPRVDGALGVDRIDLNAYLPPATPADGDDWSDRPISFAGLRGIDGKLDIAANALFYGDIDTGQVRVTGALAEGALDVSFTRMALFGGASTARIMLDGRGQMPSMQWSMKADGLAASRLAAALVGADIADGRAALEVSLSTSGASQREMVSLLKGTAAVTLTDGAFKRADLAAMAAGVKSAILTGWTGGANDRTAFSALTASFTVADGIATTNDLKLEGPGLSITGAGTVDLLRRSLDLKVLPASGSTSILLKGPWNAPKTLLDVAAEPATAPPPAPLLSDPAAPFTGIAPP